MNMKDIRVMIVDDNEELRSQLAEYLKRLPDMTVVGEADNGMSAVKTVGELGADIMLLDMIMPVMDGFGVLARLQQMDPAKRPKIIAVTALGRDDFIRRAVEMGANYYMIKPVEMDVVAARIRDVAEQQASAAAPAPSMPFFSGNSLDDQLSNLFLALGIPAHIKGYQFLREAVKLTVANPAMIGAITKELYPAIAHKFASTPSKVERAIRHAIEVAWNRGRVDILNQRFGCEVAFPGEKPTNGEFIALIADKLSQAVNRNEAG